MKYKRIVVLRPGGPEALHVIEEELADPAPGEVRVKVKTAGVLLADVMWQEGKVPGGPEPPFTPGYDLVGIVDKVGDGVAGLEVGQTVATMVQYGGYTEYAILPVEVLVPVPDGLDPAEVACLTVGYVTAYQIFKRVARLTPGERILIHGAAGGTGSAMVDLGRLMEFKVYGTASKPKHDLVSSLGARPIDYRNEDFVERILDLTGDGVDLVVDPIGGSHLRRSFRTLRPGGVLVSTAAMSQMMGEGSLLETMLGICGLAIWNVLPNGKSAVLFDVVRYNKRNPGLYAEDMKVLLDYLAEGKIKPVVAKQMPMSGVQQAQELLLGAKVKGKIVLVPPRARPQRREVKVKDFQPSMHGFKFPNYFPGLPLPEILEQFVDTSKSVHGLCGGMCFTVVDHFKAQMALPDTETVPDEDSPLYTYLKKRQLASWGMMSSQVLRYAHWMALSDEKAQQETLESWQELRKELHDDDLGVIGLVYHDLRETVRIWDNHQALAHGYTEMPDGTIHIHIYDPNYAQNDRVYVEAKPVKVKLPAGNEVPGLSCAQYVGAKQVNNIHGFFLVPYEYSPPPDGLV